ncbi:MAG: DUF6468 domain-containing protein [Acetobacter papayae]|uniref:DUF6468 domain-containing protein n=1 Tax=Acetobacter papayae TaxID=1076592 RepID=UPI0039ECD034
MLTQIQMIIEVVLSIFLFLGIIYSFYLGRVLSNLKRDRESLLGLVEKLESSVKSADQGVEKLRIAGEVSGRPLSRMVEQARLAGVELDSVVNKADAAADRLEALVTQLPLQEKKLENLIKKVADLRLEQLREEKIAAQEAELSDASVQQDETALELQPHDPPDGQEPVEVKSAEEPASAQKDKREGVAAKKGDAADVREGKKSTSAVSRIADGNVGDSIPVATGGKGASGNARLRKRPYMQMLEQTFLGRQGE